MFPWRYIIKRFLVSVLVLSCLVVAAPVSASAAIFAKEQKMGTTTYTNFQGKDAPTCKVDLTYKKPRAGEQTTIFWRSTKATIMTGLYSAAVHAPNGSMNITFGKAGTENITLLFAGAGGITTCVLKVQVRERVS